MKIIWSRFNWNEITAIQNALCDSKNELIAKGEELLKQRNRYLTTGVLIIESIFILLGYLFKAISFPLLGIVFITPIVIHILCDKKEKSLFFRLPVMQYNKIVNQINMMAINEIEKIQRTVSLITESIEIKEHMSNRPETHLDIHEQKINNEEIWTLKFFAEGYTKSENNATISRRKYEKNMRLGNHDEISIVEQDSINFSKLDESLLNEMYTLKEMMSEMPVENNLLRLEEKTKFLNNDILDTTEEYIEIE